MTKTRPESPEPTKGLAPATGPATGLVDEHGWRPIESAPSDGTAILVTGGPRYGRAVHMREADGEWWRMQKKEGSTGQPTHWQPLPAPPESGNE